MIWNSEIEKRVSKQKQKDQTLASKNKNKRLSKQKMFFKKYADGASKKNCTEIDEEAERFALTWGMKIYFLTVIPPNALERSAFFQSLLQ